jgi:hypothetical protein
VKPRSAALICARSSPSSRRARSRSFRPPVRGRAQSSTSELQLRFYCYLGLRGKEPNGLEEQAEQAQFDGDKGYKAALLSTLKRTRELLAEGRL